MNYLSIYENCRRRVRMPWLRVGGTPQPCLRPWGAPPLPRETRREPGEMPVQAQEQHPKDFTLPWAAGGLGSTAVAVSVLRGACCPRTLPAFRSRQPTLARAAGQRVLPAAEGTGNPASPNRAQGCPVEKNLLAHCLKE